MPGKKWKPEDDEKALKKLVGDTMRAAGADPAARSSAAKRRLKEQAEGADAERYIRDEQAGKKKR
jgi:hypothetical protein